jgi:hypothetical protein
LRRKWLVRIAIGYVFIACFLAWNEQRNRVIAIQGPEITLEQRREIVKKITECIQEGNQIAKTFEVKNDKDLITSQFDGWNDRCDDTLKENIGDAYSVSFEAAKGNGLMLMNHSIDGDGVYSLLQGKIAVLNSFLSEFRSPLLLPNTQSH